MSSILVIDIGSAEIKAGFANESEPRVILPTVTAVESWFGGIMVGKEAILGGLDHIHPVQGGIIKNFTHFEQIMKQLINKELNIQETIKDVRILQPCFPKSHEQQPLIQKLIIKLLDESPGRNGLIEPHFRFLNHAKCVMTMRESQTELIIDFGHNMTQIMPVIEGKSDKYLSTFYPIGGRDLTENLRQMIESRRRKTNFEHAEWVKRQDPPMRKYAPKFFEIRDSLFRPTFPKAHLGFQKNCVEIIKCYSPKLQELLFSNILLIGGGAELYGIAKVFHDHMKQEVENDVQIKVRTADKPKIIAWQGAAQYY